MRQLPRESATAVAQHGPAVLWGPVEHLLAGIFDATQWGNYQRARGRGAKPQKWPRPGEEPKTFGKPVPIEEGRRILARRNGITRAS